MIEGGKEQRPLGSMLYWCGYEPNPSQPGGGCHRWLPDRMKAVRFMRIDDAWRSGVGAPNTPYGRADITPDRGVFYAELNDAGEWLNTESRNGRPHD